MYRYGFELEGFCVDPEDGQTVVPPPVNYPTDGFPGLVELRSTGGKTLIDAYTEIVGQRIMHPGIDFNIPKAKFSANDRAILRRRHVEKRAVDIILHKTWKEE